MQNPSVSEWRLHLAGPPRVHLVPELDPCARLAADELEFRTYTVELDRVDGKAGLMQSVDAAMRLPGYFGRNWDALLDVLTDSSWDRAPGYLLILEGSQPLARTARKEFVQFVEILVEATIRMYRYGHGLHAIVPGEAARSATIGGLGESKVCDHFLDSTEP